MNKFTVKDFIKYNAPCFNCKKATTISLNVMSLKYDWIDPGLSQLYPIIDKHHFKVALKITYSTKLLLTIDLLTNNF